MRLKKYPTILTKKQIIIVKTANAITSILGAAFVRSSNFHKYKEEVEMATKDDIQFLKENNSTEDLIKEIFKEVNSLIKFDTKKHQYSVQDVDGNYFRIPSVTQIKAPYDPDFSTIPKDILERKVEIGIHVHKRAEGKDLNPFAE